jgi:hypothetical protein
MSSRVLFQPHCQQKEVEDLLGHIESLNLNNCHAPFLRNCPPQARCAKSLPSDQIREQPLPNASLMRLPAPQLAERQVKVERPLATITFLLTALLILEQSAKT